MNNLKLAVDVVRAHNLLPKDGQGSSSAAVELIFDGQRFRTTIKEKDLNPHWNETFYFNVSNPLDLHNLSLEAHLYSINKSTNKKHSLGKLRINGTSFVPYSDAVVFNYPLEKNGLFSSTRGELALKVYLTGDLNSSSSVNLHDVSSRSSSSLHSIHDHQSPRHRHEETVASDRPSNGRTTRTRRSLYTIPGSDHQQQRASSSSYQTAQQYVGVGVGGGVGGGGGGEMRFEPQADFALKETRPALGGGRPVRPRAVYDLVEPMQFLFVRVVKARDLPTKDITGSLDPYVEVKLGNYKGVTRHFEKTKSPEWNTVFTFSKDRMQSSVLEVVVMDKDVIKDDFVGVVRFDLQEIPRRAPPDSPLAPEWHRLDDNNNKGETRQGELMLAVWIGTQADEAFADAWHSDEASLVDNNSLPSTQIRSKVYHSPRLWYVRVNVIEVQDLIVADRNRFPLVHVKAQIGNQVLKTKSVQSQTMNALWNEDLMFVAAEPFDDHLVVSVDDRVGPNKDEMLGKVFVPLAMVERRADDRVVHSKWFNLQRPNETDHVEEGKRDQHHHHHHFSSRIHLRICLDGGYHVLDESTQYSSDLRPTAKQLWKPPVGTIEVGILNADALTPMKTRNGRGTSDTFCVAKYGQKWIRTRTITDSLNPKFNEQYTWDVFDPATVLTVGVFDNGHLTERGAAIANGNGNRDMKIGKVRIRISTLETDRVYTHSYPLIVLHPSGVKKMGELHLAIRFTCNSMFNMMALYSRPLLPKMHYIRPLSVVQLDHLRYQAVNVLAARLSRAEPPLRKEVIEYMSDANSHLWSMRRSKANFYRLMAVFNGVFAVWKWLNEVCQWKNPVTTILVYALFIMLVFFPELILPTTYLYMFLIGLWNYRFRPRNPPHMNMRLSCADAATPDELDEEFDTFPTARNADILRMRYERLRSVSGRIQRVVGDVAAQGERVQALLSWRDPRATVIFMAFCIVSAIVFYAVPLQLMVAAAGSYVMRPLRFRHKLPAPPLNFFRRLPARTDSML